MTRNQMINYYHKHYHPKNAVLFVVGNFEKVSTKKLIKKYFSTDIKTQEIKFPKVKMLFNGPRVNIFNKDIKESHFVLGFNAFKEFDKNIPIISIINSLLSSGFNSRLFLNIREKLGGTYYIHSGSYAMYDRGVFELSAGVNNGRTEEILSAVIGEIKKLKTEKVSNEELNKVKNRLLSSTLMNFDNPYFATNPIYDAVLYNHKVVSHRQRIDNLMKVTSDDVQKVSNQIFTAKNIKLGMLTNGHKAKPFEKIIAKI
ncbi:MAG: pitrilysin family protein [Candidatus Paceibacterota bacterium]